MTTKINASTAGLTETVDASGILELQTANTTAVIIDASQNANFASTGAITVPVGTTAQRPTGVNGMIRYNSNSTAFEFYVNGTWATANVTPPPVISVAPVISGSPVVGSNLTSTTGTWTNTPTGYYYQWLANSTAISNATANVFTLTSTQNGANITCNITAYNAAGNSTPSTSNTLGPVTATYTISTLTVAGGGGGGRAGGGGGAGGLLANTVSVTGGTTYTVTVGGGGAGSPAPGDTHAANGSASSISGTGLTTISTVGGGGGGSAQNPAGYSGGSGGGGGGRNSPTAGGSGTSGQGNAGGSGDLNNVQGGGGGGGAGASGESAPSTRGGNGGNGSASSITGSSVTYAGGGGGGAHNSGSGGSGGTGGGGNGGSGMSAGTANTGGGGGSGGPAGTIDYGAAGGSGVVILSIPTTNFSNSYTGSSVVKTTSGSNTILTFNSSGTYTA